MDILIRNGTIYDGSVARQLQRMKEKLSWT